LRKRLIPHVYRVREAGSQVPEITQADIGRRMYQLHKEKSVERTTEMLRESLGSDWKSFTDADIHLLEQLIGDVWVGFDKVLWEKIRFDLMKKDDVDRLLTIGKYMVMDKTPKTQVRDEVQKILQAVR
jgi:hypothetical protein